MPDGILRSYAATTSYPEDVRRFFADERVALDGDRVRFAPDAVNSYTVALLADFLQESMRRELCNPFLTPLHTQDGGLVGEGQQTLSLEQIISMDYLTENVVGSIPAYAELSPLGQATVDMAGVEPATAGGSED